MTKSQFQQSSVMKILPLFLMLVIVTMTACSNKVEAQTVPIEVERDLQPDTTNVAALVSDNTDFAFDLYAQLAAEENGNFIFSPYSISSALAMLYAGVRGETATQLADVMHYTLPQEQLHPAFNALNLALQPLEVPPTPTPDSFGSVPPDNLTLNIANSIWGQDGFDFESSFLETLGLNYGARLNVVDFSGNPDGARQSINQWVIDATNGRIADMPPADAITPQTRLMLVNAIYFRGEWTYPFQAENTHEGTFHLEDGSEVSAQMMVNGFAYMDCARGEDYYAVRLTYGAFPNAAMLILIPDAGTFDDYENGLDTTRFQEARDGLESTNLLTLTMPRFSFESDINLRETLSAMGATIPFSAGADFTGISDTGLFIDYAAHRATISVDEQGTEATGATMVSMAVSGVFSQCESDVRADRPFIFVIYHQSTGAILFLGRVMNPVS